MALKRAVRDTILATFIGYCSSATAHYVESDPVGLAGGTNTYAYARSNPVSFIDPFGLDCITANGTVTCNVPGGPVISFPQPSKDWPAAINPGLANYHHYDKLKGAGNVDQKCLSDYIRNHPTPGSPQPASPTGTPNDATPSWASLFGSSPVESYVMSYQGLPVVVNVTLPGHPLFPGYVARVVVPTPSGNIVNNFGEGLGWKQNPNFSLINDPLINNVWYQLTDDAIKACSCGGK